MTIAELTSFLAWCTAINFGFLILAWLAMVVGKDAIQGIHSRMFGLDQKFVDESWYKFLAYFKLLVIVFNLTPYLVLRIFF